MFIKIRIPISLKTAQEFRRWMRLSTMIPAVCLLFPMVALAQGGSPFDTGFTSIQTLFTGTIAKVASLVAIVIGGYGFAHGAHANEVKQSALDAQIRERLMQALEDSICANWLPLLF